MIDSLSPPHEAGAGSPVAPRAAARLDAELAADVTLGLLHEVNNRMTGVFFTLETCLETPELPAPLAEELGQVLHGLRAAQALIDRASELHLGLRETSYHEATALLQRQRDLLQLVLPSHLHFELRPAAELLHLHLDEGGFRVLLLQVAAWLRPRLARASQLTLTARAAHLPTTRQPAVAMVFHVAGDPDLPAAPALDLAGSEGELTLTHLSAGRGVEIALLFPRVQFTTEA